eukprot:697123-Hanusia_phi.AAC.1
MVSLKRSNERWPGLGLKAGVRGYASRREPRRELRKTVNHQIQATGDLLGLAAALPGRRRAAARRLLGYYGTT